jgi:hypothetical protein
MVSELPQRELATRPPPSVSSSVLAPAMSPSRLQVPLTSLKRCSSVEPPTAPRATLLRPLKTWEVVSQAELTEKTLKFLSRSSRVMLAKPSSFLEMLSLTALLTPTNSSSLRRRLPRSTKTTTTATWKLPLRTAISMSTEST